MSHIFNSFLELKELAANFDESKVRRLLTKLNNPTYINTWFYSSNPIERLGFKGMPKTNPWIKIIKVLMPLSGSELKITLQKEIAWFWNNLGEHKLWLRK